MPLENSREALDKLDAEIVRLLDKRARLGKEIGEIKRKHNLPLHHPEREIKVLQRIRHFSDGSCPPRSLDRIYRVIMGETLALQAAGEKAGQTDACHGNGQSGKKDIGAAIVENTPVAPGYNRMRLLVPELADAFTPGQFFQLRLGDKSSGFFLRRPFAPSECHSDGFSFIYAVVGGGTEHLAAAAPGSRVDILAPLGSAFTLAPQGSSAVIFGGGYGAPSLAPLAARLARAGVRVSVILGARTVSALLNRAAFADSGRLVTATDDGSHGCCGTVVDAFRQDVAETMTEGCRFYACGPIPMLRAVAGLAEAKGVPCEVSLEERMACGFGACMGCAVPVRDKDNGFVYRRVCHEGPVFQAADIAWEQVK